MPAVYLGFASRALDEVSDLEENIDIPWPRTGDKVFTFGDDWWMNACVNWGGGWTLYAIGYKSAGDVLVERVAANRGEADALVYPIVFCYRQYLELMLKDTLGQARRYHGIDEQFDNKHSLLHHWLPLRKLLERRWPERPEPLDAVEDSVRQFDEVDEGSFAFRYSVSTSGKPSLPSEMQHINLRNLAQVVARIGTFLEACATGLSAEREAAE
jgi:hypothetical protein